MTQPYRLHMIPDFASLIPRLALEEMGIDYEMVLHDIDAGTLADPAYRKINPMGLIPALETPQGPMFETGAILLWLADRHGALAPAPDAPDRGAFLSWLVFVANTLHPTSLMLAHPERPADGHAVPQVLAATRAALMRQFAHLEALVDRTPWFAAKAPSILTIYVAVLRRWCAIVCPDLSFCIPPDTFPALKAMLAVHEARPAFLRVAVAEDLGPTPFSDPRPYA